MQCALMTESKNGNICIFYVAPPNLGDPGKKTDAYKTQIQKFQGYMSPNALQGRNYFHSTNVMVLRSNKIMWAFLI